MQPTHDWSTWMSGGWRWFWVAWFAAFVIAETITLWRYPGQELTAHIRPLFNSHPLTWYLLLGLWLWMGIHFLAPAQEGKFLEWLTRY